MAGDWIKFEISTASKPEVLRIAELLGVDRRHAIGLLIDFWAWLDQNCSDGSVTHMSSQSFDSVTHCPGFAAALADVGWVKINLSTGKLSVVNFDRHNGKPAKTRALSQERMKRKRYADSVTNREPEKRREELYKPNVVVTPTVGVATNPHNASGINGKPKPPRWDDTDAGIDAKGRELGVPSRPGEGYFEYKGRIWHAINEAKRGSH